MDADLRLTPDLFHRNAFAVLGVSSNLPNDAIRDRTAHMIRLISNGKTDDLTALSLGGFTTLADSAAIEEAMARLEDPAVRICDEVFWFHPGTEGGHAPSLRGRNAPIAEEPIWRWIEYEAFGLVEESLAATHNLAVMYSIVALEIEAQISARPEGGGLTQAMREDAAIAWHHALTRWRLLEAAPNFRIWLQGRIQKIGADLLTENQQMVLGRLLNSGLGQLLTMLETEYSNDARHDDTARIRAIAVAHGLDGQAL